MEPDGGVPEEEDGARVTCLKTWVRYSYQDRRGTRNSGKGAQMSLGGKWVVNISLYQEQQVRAGGVMGGCPPAAHAVGAFAQERSLLANNTAANNTAGPGLEAQTHRHGIVSARVLTDINDHTSLPQPPDLPPW